MPQNIMCALCAVIQQDHFKFASYGPVDVELYFRNWHHIHNAYSLLSNQDPQDSPTDTLCNILNPVHLSLLVQWQRLGHQLVICDLACKRKESISRRLTRHVLQNQTMRQEGDLICTWSIVLTILIRCAWFDVVIRCDQTNKLVKQMFILMCLMLI